MSRSERLTLFKGTLNDGEEALKAEHLAGAKGLEIATRRTDLIDVILRELFIRQAATLDVDVANSLTLIATGGYGRGLLNPFSDIDLLFLHNDKMKTLDPSVQEMVEGVLYTLWDLGLKVGHATRSIKGCLDLALEDFETLSSFIESRIIHGDETLFDQFLARVRSTCLDGREDAYLNNRLEDLHNRHQRALDTIYVQEPNIKTGVGGLRDYHNILWMSFVKLKQNSVTGLREAGLLTRESYQEMEAAYDFLHRVRNDLHYEENRARDVLTLFLQGVVATHFGYPQRSILRRCEAFMRDYYHHTRRMREITSQVMEGFQIESEHRKSTGIISFLARRRPAVDKFDEFNSIGDRLFAESPTIFTDDPLRMMRTFQHTQLRHLRLSPALKDQFAADRDLIDRAFRYNKMNRETFMAILSRRGDVARALRQMHRVGFLGAYMPEFGALDCLVQHEFFHRYTADEHTLRCIEELDHLSEPKDDEQRTFAVIFNELDDPSILYLAMILHDTGRAENARYHEDASALLASKVCSRFQIKGARRRLLIFLVDHHLTLWKTATTKNLEDPNTIADFAQVVRDPTFLKYLYLFTYADSKGTSSESWNGWKASLMAQLYNVTMRYFLNQPEFERQLAMVDTELEAAVTKRLPASFAEEVRAHFAYMPPRYLQSRRDTTIVQHIRVFRMFFEKLHSDDDSALNPACLWQARQDQGCSKLLIASWNRENLLARIVGCLTALNLNILSADIFTRKDNLALDVFRVCTTNLEPVTNERTLKEFENLMNQVFCGTSYNMADLVKLGESRQLRRKQDLPEFPQRVLVSNNVDPKTTFVEIQALDRLALLGDIFTVFEEMNLVVHHSRINTTRGAAIDSFYVTDAKENQLNEATLGVELANRLESALNIPPR